MRKIVSKQEAEKKKRKNQFIVGGVLIFVMFMSVMGYAFQNSALGGSSGSSTNSNQTVNYDGVNFVNQNGFWVLQSGNVRLAFTYNPSEIPASNLTGLTKIIQDFSGKPLYIYSNDSTAKSELEFNMKNFASSIQEGNLTSSGLGPDCSFNSIIIENTNNETGVKEKQNCIIISGQGEELIKTIDNLLFKLLGIRQ